MSNKGTSVRIASTAKAGKRSTGYVAPPPINPFKQDGKELGEQQFVAKEQLTVKREVEIVVYDKALKAFVKRKKTVTIPVDFVMDESRGRPIKSPSKERIK